ncbi:MAG: hypothetical protein IPF45_01835 [Thermomonas sp.]|nr:hypothetical protein [Thermomonas sp.]
MIMGEPFGDAGPVAGVGNAENEKGAEAPFDYSRMNRMRRQVQRWMRVVLMSHARPALPQATLFPIRCHARKAWWAVQGSNL